jgi:hypothetical protein
MEHQTECQLSEEPFNQCCCVCAHHLADYYHCHDTVLRNRLAKHYGSDKCICDIQRGWICVVRLDDLRAHSEWPEHSCGCEMFSDTRKKEADK